MQPLPMGDLSDPCKLNTNTIHELTKQSEAGVIPDVTRTADSVDFHLLYNGKAVTGQTTCESPFWKLLYSVTSTYCAHVDNMWPCAFLLITALQLFLHALSAM